MPLIRAIGMPKKLFNLKKKPKPERTKTTVHTK